ncbi:Gfo/Idh/MocA family oxidoreductase (plasmid) [Paracoccus liaowanqingii]|uniref:Gfo/Idh/MocA family oxidoreductase n=1 Tax=Paracoccus liaowanqingii TaxID=2560053 RepID=A0A4Y5SS96_9RHOB|nr:Gfo/Idh/MocA family oxidoreductase [Paracoccus liaowanqingii]QDA36372.1 Gfo/Idh/MocA family oxidoreductase [Paracoccus liaowanqingii]
MTPLGLGIIGCGVISDIYLQNAALFPQLALRAVADLRREAAEAKAQAHGIDALTPEALLARDDIDVVLNLTVPAAHLQVGLAALRAGKHVYSEKPLAVSLADGRRLADMAAERGLRLGCAPDTFLGGSHQTARALLDAGRIGRPVAGTATLMLAGHERWHPNPDFYYQGPGAGPLFDMGPYYITAMVNLLGPVRRVNALASRAHDRRVIATGPRAGQSVDVDALTHVAGVMEFEGGALIQIATSFDVQAHGHAPLELYGTEGSLRIPDPNRFDGTVELSDKGWQPQATSHPHGDGNYRGLGLADMAGAILQDRPHRASGDLALHVLDVITSLLDSARTGQAVTLATSCTRPEALAPDAPLTRTEEVA